MVEVRGVEPLTLYFNDVRINHYVYEREGFEPSLRLVSSVLSVVQEKYALSSVNFQGVIFGCVKATNLNRSLLLYVQFDLAVGQMINQSSGEYCYDNGRVCFQ